MFSAGNFKVIEFDKLTRTAQEAATALGCEVGQIAKSIVFKTETENPVLVVASGINRIDETKVEKVIGMKIFKADAEYVKKSSGYVIGGVPPWGHQIMPITIIDKDLARFERIYAAAGKNNAVFELTFDDLVSNTKGNVIEVA
ncbi:MAG: YbaK/EbsC family protein [Candidatus Shapirobacteria bacterium]|jgi:prolyl-tRNA editing enzyme YbaK/EbsC (Cys-tRNA(Pro) deacylase)